MTTPPQYPEQSQATLALVLGIFSLICLPVLGPFAWTIGNNELKGIDAGRRDPANRGLANAGKILGIIGTVLIVVLVGFLVITVVAVNLAGQEVSETFQDVTPVP